MDEWILIKTDTELSSIQRIKNLWVSTSLKENSAFSQRYEFCDSIRPLLKLGSKEKETATQTQQLCIIEQKMHWALDFHN